MPPRGQPMLHTPVSASSRAGLCKPDPQRWSTWLGLCDIWDNSISQDVESHRGLEDAILGSQDGIVSEALYGP